MFKKAVALEDAYLDFILSRQAMLCAPGTLRFYKFTAGKFVQWLDVDSLEEISTTHVRKYLSELAERGLSDSYIHGHARAIRTILRFFQAEGYISEPLNFQMPSLGNLRLPILNPTELKFVIDACASKRDRALVILIADSGLRRSELCSLNWGDIDISTGLVRVRRGKGKKSRTVVIGAKTRRILLAYRRTVNSMESEPVFQISTGKRLTPMGLRSVFLRLGKKTGIKVTPHALRRTFATLSLKAGMSLVHLQSLMGHSSIEMTRHYIQLLDEDLIEAHRESSPIDNLFS